MIDNHIQDSATGSRPLNYWRDKVRPNSESAFHFNSSHHHQKNYIGEFYLRNGMKIDLNSGDEKASNLKDVMSYIQKNLGQNNIFEKLARDKIGGGNFDQRDKVSETSAAKKSNKNIKSIEIFGGVFEEYSEKKSANKMDSLYENYIKAIAVSILAETNGNSKIAKDILENGGMREIKNFKPESMKILLEQLKDISADPSKQI